MNLFGILFILYYKEGEQLRRAGEEGDYFSKVANVEHIQTRLKVEGEFGEKMETVAFLSDSSDAEYMYLCLFSFVKQKKKNF